MQIVIIGSGNVATVLGRLCKQQGHEIVLVMSRNKLHAKILADELHCAYADYNEKLTENAGLYLLAVSDTALYEMDKNFTLGNKLVLHTAGSVSKDVLKTISTNYGVLYPLQSLRKEMKYLAETPFLIDGNTADTITLIEDFARTLSSSISIANDQQRLKLHVSAVLVSNFTNHLYALAESFCIKEQLDYALLGPLIKETAQRAVAFSPAAVQTGPAVRNDVFTIEKHLQILHEYPQIKNLYIRLSESIMKV